MASLCPQLLNLNRIVIDQIFATFVRPNLTDAGFISIDKDLKSAVRLRLRNC